MSDDDATVEVENIEEMAGKLDGEHREPEDAAEIIEIEEGPVDMGAIGNTAQEMLRSLSLIVLDKPCSTWRTLNNVGRENIYRLIEELILNPDASLFECYSVYRNLETDTLTDGEKAEAMMLRVAIKLRLGQGI